MILRGGGTLAPIDTLIGTFLLAAYFTSLFESCNLNHCNFENLNNVLPEKSFSLSDSNYNDVSPEGLLLYNGGTVCDDEFSDNSADAICREMGFEQSTSWRKFGSVWDIQEKVHITLDNVNCPEGGSWSSCSYSESNNCEHDEDVYLSCQGENNHKINSMPFEFCNDDV